MEINKTLLNLSKEVDLLVNYEKDFSVIEEISNNSQYTFNKVQRLKDGKIFLAKVNKNKRQTKNERKAYSNEVRAMYHCANPFSIKLVGYSITAPFVIISEKIKEEKLTYYLKQKSLDNTQKNYIALCIAYCLKIIHLNEFIHRNITSDNIIISNKKVYVSGFENVCNTSSNSNICEEISVPYYMPPEYLNSEAYNEKLDVYSFGMILFQLCTDSVHPFIGFEMKPKKLTKKIIGGLRPEIPDNVPEDIANLIKRCWAQNPKERPSFKDIFKKLRTKAITFKDIDKNKLDKMIEEFDEADAELSKIQYRELARTAMPEFKNDLVRQSHIHNPKFVAVFFHEMKHLFSPNTGIKQFSYILDVTQKLIQDKNACNAFVEEKLHFRLPYEREELLDQCLDILFLVVIHSPNALDSNYAPFIKYLMKRRPHKIISIISEIAKKLDIMNDPLLIIDAAIKSWKIAFNTPSVSANFLSLFYYICKIYPQYKTTRGDACKALFSKFIHCKSKEAVCVAYNGLLYFVGPRLEIDYKHAIECLNDINTEDTMLSLLLKLEILCVDPKDIETQKKFVITLLGKAQKSNKANLLLCRLADEDPNCGKILAQNNSWLSCELPTYSSTLRIMLVLMKHKSFRKKMAKSENLMYLLYSLCQVESGVSTKVIFQICRAYGITPENIDLWNKSGFLKQYINYAYDLNNERSYINCFALFHEIAFVKEIPLLETLIDLVCIVYSKFKGSHKMVISLLTNISHIPTCAVKMYDIGVLDLIQDDLTKKESNKFTVLLNKHMHSAQILQNSAN